MKFIKSKLIEISLLLMVCSTIANILFYLDIITQPVAQFGFIIVIIFSIFINVSSANNRKNNRNINIERSPSAIIATSIITISWALSYAAAMF